MGGFRDYWADWFRNGEKNIMQHSMAKMDRRQALSALGGTVLALGGRSLAYAEEPRLYIPPASRIGFRCPENLRPFTNQWELIPPDPTLMITIGESVRLDFEDETGKYPWTSRRDRRYRQIQTSVSLDGYEVRSFQNQHYEGNRDSSDDMLVICDDHWIGAITLSIRPLVKRPVPQEGLVAHWRPIKEAIFKSLFVRAALPIQTALAELHIRLDVPDLHPRMVGENLVLSLSAPKDAYAAFGKPPCIISNSLTRRVPIPVDVLSENITKEFDTYRALENAIVLSSPASTCRGVLLPENEYIPQSFSRKLEIFGKSRQLTLRALYGPDSRSATIDALHRVFKSLNLEEIN